MKYIRLATCDGSFDKKFRVFVGGYSPIRERMNTQQRSWTGKLDNQGARAVEIRQYTLIVFETEITDCLDSDSDTEGYGTLEDLITLYNRNGIETDACTGPPYIPGNVLTLYDFDGEQYSVLLIGTVTPTNISHQLEGVSAVYYVPVEMLLTE